MGRWYRGGDSVGTGPRWFAASEQYAAFYGDAQAYDLDETDILDLSTMGVDVDVDSLRELGAPERAVTVRTSSGEAYEWAERAVDALRAAGYRGVIVRQWNADYGAKPQKTMLYWG